MTKKHETFMTKKHELFMLLNYCNRRLALFNIERYIKALGRPAVLNVTICPTSRRLLRPPVGDLLGPQLRGRKLRNRRFTESCVDRLIFIP